MIETPELSLARIQVFPKIDLHRHLLGSARPETLWDLCLKYNLMVDYGSVKEFTKSIVGRVSHGDLAEYIRPWKLLREAVRDAEDIQRIAQEAAFDARLDGVRYVEFRSSLSGLPITDGESPQTRIPTDDYLCAIERAFSATPGIECRLIASVPRHAVGPATPVMVEKYADRFFDAVARFRKLIVGVDLTGVERGWPASLFKDIFVQARSMGLPITIHAGETEGPEEVWAAIDELGASRIGHGTSAPRDPILVEELIKRKVVLEVCPTSGWLIGRLKERYRHPIIDCIRPIPYVICTDNPTLNASTLSHELGLAAQISNLQPEFILRSQFQLASEAAFSPTALTCLVRSNGSDEQRLD
jgi:adenosine deaminase